ncbi:protein transporter [Reticulomyxa filosa]|uniref:Protein transporter n=1 Tax=Reticulomyxa filosa TaxID=46433 RepID=X6MKE9_RETFI|nr:protein transporter [Reticulomyxa filosa]|eukprot:ETO14483.1 protein transporter [Reticulomyxa filosa]
MFTDDNRRDFQRGIDFQQGKVKRMEERLNLRRQIREGHLNKRRKALNETEASAIKDDHDTENINTGNCEQKPERKPGGITSEIHIKNLNKFIEKVKSGNLQLMVEGVEAVRQLLSIEEKPPIDQVLDTNVVPYLIKVVKQKILVQPTEESSVENEKKFKLQFEASWYAFCIFCVYVCAFLFCFVCIFFCCC